MAANLAPACCCGGPRRACLATFGCPECDFDAIVYANTEFRCTLSWTDPVEGAVSADVAFTLIDMPMKRSNAFSCLLDPAPGWYCEPAIGLPGDCSEGGCAISGTSKTIDDLGGSYVCGLAAACHPTPTPEWVATYDWNAALYGASVLPVTFRITPRWARMATLDCADGLYVFTGANFLHLTGATVSMSAEEADDLTIAAGI
jgi:hypothetical protein